MVEQTPEEKITKIQDVAKELEAIQIRYNTGEKITDEELQKASASLNLSIEDIKNSLEPGKQTESTDSIDESEMTEQEFDKLDKHYSTLIEKPNITEQELQEIADFYSLTLEEVKESRKVALKASSESMITKTFEDEVKQSLLRRLLRFIRRIFR